MNKILIIILFALAGAGIFYVLWTFDPLPPYTTAIVTIAQSWGKTINQMLSPYSTFLTGLISNPAIIASIGVSAGGLLVNYIRGKMQANVEEKAAETKENLQNELIGVYNKAGQLESQNKKLTDKLDEYSSYDWNGMQASLTAKDQEIEKLIADKNAVERLLNRKDVIVEEHYK